MNCHVSAFFRKNVAFVKSASSKTFLSQLTATAMHVLFCLFVFIYFVVSPNDILQSFAHTSLLIVSGVGNKLITVIIH